MIKEGTHVHVGALYARCGIRLIDEQGAHGIVYGWSYHFNRYAVLVDGWLDCIMVPPECMTVIEDFKED